MKQNWKKLIGNDLVDLNQAQLESNWRRSGYLAKIYTPEEQELILQSRVPDCMLWLLWTMKEAAYKIVNRHTGIRSYSPLSFVCADVATDELQASGCVIHSQRKFFIQSTVNHQFIHSTAVSMPEDFSALTPLYLKNNSFYQEKFNSLYLGYQLLKTKSGLPELIHTPTGNRHAVSVSHHGEHLAIIYSDSLLLTD